MVEMLAFETNLQREIDMKDKFLDALQTKLR